MDMERRMAKKRFHLARETKVEEIFEVEAKNLDDALSLLQLQEARLLATHETEPVITRCWEKPTGLADDSDS